MKKIALIAALILILTVALPVSISAQVPSYSKVYYNDIEYKLPVSLVSYDSEFFFDSQDIASILGIYFATNEEEEFVSIYEGSSIKTIKMHTPDFSIWGSETYVHDLPESINGHLYIPFTFLKNSLNLIVRYDQVNNIVYMYSRDKVENSGKWNFSIPLSNFELSLSNELYLAITQPEIDLSERTVSFSDRQGSYSAVLSCEVIDSLTFTAMRQFLNDFTSTEQVMFQKIVDYRRNYLKAIQNTYNREFLFADVKGSPYETYMKFFGEYDESLFGQKSYSSIFNICRSGSDFTSEKTYISIMVPNYENMTIYNLNFQLPSGNLDDAALKKIADVLYSVRINHRTAHEDLVNVLRYAKPIELSNAGIFSLNSLEPSKSHIGLSTLYGNGYSIQYPSSYIPYRQNRLIEGYDYRSFKLDFNNYFTIYVYPSQGMPSTDDITAELVATYGSNLQNVTHSTFLSGTRTYIYTCYSVLSDAGHKDMQVYRTYDGSRLFTFTLNSRNNEPSALVSNEFRKIALSLRPAQTVAQSSSPAFTRVKYTDKSGGYSITYPYNWKVSTDYTYNDYKQYKIAVPDLHGPVAVTVSQGEFSSVPGSNEISLLASSTSLSGRDIVKHYWSPYSNSSAAVVLASDMQVKQGKTYINKLVSYIDEGDRIRYCHVVDIVNGARISSLFITVSDYTTFEGSILNKQLSANLKMIKDSFTHVDP